jgi:hypothetical protein
MNAFGMVETVMEWYRLNIIHTQADSTLHYLLAIN